MAETVKCSNCGQHYEKGTVHQCSRREIGEAVSKSGEDSGHPDD